MKPTNACHGKYQVNQPITRELSTCMQSELSFDKAMALAMDSIVAALGAEEGSLAIMELTAEIMKEQGQAYDNA